MKKFLLITSILILLIPQIPKNAAAAFTNADFENGFFDNPSVEYETDIPYAMRDNNLSTSARMVSGVNFPGEDKRFVFFHQPVNIKNVKLKINKWGSTISMYFTVTNAEGETNVKSFQLGSEPEQVINVDAQDVIRFEISTTSQDTIYVYEIELFEKQMIQYEEVSNLNITNNGLKNHITFEKPSMEGYTGANIYRNGVLIASLDSTQTSFEDTVSEYKTTYTYKVTALYGADETDGIEKSITTGERVIEEIKDINVSTKYDRVEIQWEVPESEDFSFVRIYRKTIEELKPIEEESGSLFEKKVYAAETDEDGPYTPLFETNGTYFNDLSVKPRSEYEYRLATVTTDGSESKGVFVSASTPDEPTPAIIGGGWTDENGEYIFTWNEPTTGTVKVLVSGEEYAVVPASQKKIAIPREKIKFVLGKPDVTLIPVSIYGKEGKPYTPNPLKQVKAPFSVSDLLKSGSSLLFVLGPFVLLALAFLIVPRFRGVFKKAIKEGRG